MGSKDVEIIIIIVIVGHNSKHEVCIHLGDCDKMCLHMQTEFVIP